MLLDITENIKDNELEQFYKYLSDASEDGFKYVNFKNGTIIVSNKYKEIFGDSDDIDTTENDIIRRVYKDDIKSAKEKSDKVFEEGLTSFEVEYRIDDGEKWISQTGTVRYDDDKNIIEKLFLFRDITESKKKQLELEYMAYFDSDTGTYNRNYFVKRLQKAIDRIPDNLNRVQVIYIDIDNYNVINDLYGFVLGDEVICKFAKILNSYTNHDVKVGRFNNDEFVMGLFDAESDKDAVNLYIDIVSKLKKPIIIGNNQEVYLSISVGIADYEMCGQTAADLIRSADIAMCSVKQRGKNGMLVFERNMLSKFVKNVKLENELKLAVDNLEFTLNYQPQFYSNEKQLRGVEALIRWKLRDGNFVSPGEFIPMAEKNGSIVHIGTWVIKKALEDFAEFKNTYGYEGIISINISTIQLRENSFSKVLTYYADYYNISPDKIEIEITESVLIEDFDFTISILRKLRDKGFKISLDDFGTGYSSLLYLRDIPINTLKIDKSFVDTMLEDESTSIITDAVIKMVKRLGLETIAEGVETEEQFNYLMRMNCDNIQGYLLGRPVPKEQLIDIILRENRNKLERRSYV